MLFENVFQLLKANLNRFHKTTQTRSESPRSNTPSAKEAGPGKVFKTLVNLVARAGVICFQARFAFCSSKLLFWDRIPAWVLKVFFTPRWTLEVAIHRGSATAGAEICTRTLIFKTETLITNISSMYTGCRCRISNSSGWDGIQI